MVATSRPAHPALVSAYHSEVDAAVEAMTAALDAGDDHATALDVLGGELHGPAARQVIDRAAQTRGELLVAARRDSRTRRCCSRPAPRAGRPWCGSSCSTSSTPCGGRTSPPYADEAAVEDAPDLVSLPRLDKAGALRFRFAVQPEGLVGRGRDAALRRLTPRRRPQVSGMKFLAARPEIVAVLNEVADLLRKEAPTGTPPLWVNSIVRSVEHQQHLSELGYSALLPSSHCLGWGADVEMTWYETFGAAESLRGILTDYRDRGVLNVIGEGQAWHLCLNPEHVAAYRDPSLTLP